MKCKARVNYFLFNLMNKGKGITRENSLSLNLYTLSDAKVEV